MGKRYVMPYYAPRLLAVLGYLEARGGLEPNGTEARLRDMASELKMPGQAVTRHIKWLEKYGVVSVTRTSEGWATGRSPNRYQLHMSYAEWTERGKDIVREHRRIKRGPAPAPTPTGPPPEQVAAEWEVLKESVRGEVEAELAMLDVIGAPVLPPLSDDEVLAWS